MENLLDFVLNNLALIVTILGIFVVIIRMLLHKFFKTEYGLTDAKGDLKVGADYLEVKGKERIYFNKISKIDLFRYFGYAKLHQPYWQPKIMINYSRDNDSEEKKIILDPRCKINIPYIALHSLRHGGDISRNNLSNIIIANKQKANPVFFRLINGEEIQFNEINPMEQEGIDDTNPGGSFKLLEK